jgi:hypothetical protein
VSEMRTGTSFCDIKRFVLEYKDKDEWKTAFEGKNMDRDDYSVGFTPITAQVFRLRILESSGELNISSFELF